MNPNRLPIPALKGVVFCLALVPLGLIFYDAFTDGLSANPIEDITRRTGRWGLRFILITLCITPLRKLTGLNVLIRFRRMLGLYAFFYLCLHFLTYVLIDAELSLAYMVEDIAKRLYITAGFTAFCLLVPLAATSTNAMVHRLGGKRWQELHRLVYPASLAAVLHFIWLVKADLRDPLIYLAILSVLLLLRLSPIAKRLPELRLSLTQSGPQRAAR